MKLVGLHFSLFFEFLAVELLFRAKLLHLIALFFEKLGTFGSGMLFAQKNRARLTVILQKIAMFFSLPFFELGLGFGFFLIKAFELSGLLLAKLYELRRKRFGGKRVHSKQGEQYTNYNTGDLHSQGTIANPLAEF